MLDLWTCTDAVDWRRALDRYDEVIARQDISRLVELDRWYRSDVPATIASRTVPHVTLDELLRITEWKMSRGVWCAPNLVLVRGNDAGQVIVASTAALATVPHPTQPIAALATLSGVGPATASAIVAAAAPEQYPFFDELVAAQVPQLGKVAWTLGYYARYAAALRQRADMLGAWWTPVTVERALWSHSGGKAAVRD